MSLKIGNLLIVVAFSILIFSFYFPNYQRSMLYSLFGILFAIGLLIIVLALFLYRWKIVIIRLLIQVLIVFYLILIFYGLITPLKVLRKLRGKKTQKNNTQPNDTYRIDMREDSLWKLSPLSTDLQNIQGAWLSFKKKKSLSILLIFACLRLLCLHKKQRTLNIKEIPDIYPTF